VTNKIKEALHQMIADGKTAGVVQQLLEITQYFGDEALESEAALLSAKYAEYSQNATNFPEEKQARELEKINQSLIELLDKVPAQGQEPKASHQIWESSEDQNQFPWWKLILILLVIGGILYLIFS
jgi:uncharacterized membrane protein YukC